MKEENEILTGTTLRVYYYMLKKGKPVGIREVQRALRLSSPTLASYHLAKLEEAGIIKQTMEGYVVDKMIFRNLVRIRSLLIPKYLFFSIFFAAATVLHVVLFKPPVLTKEYVFATVVMMIATLSYIYETCKILLKNKMQSL
ncbi:MAG: winged helix-turn-helix domain-containing protein [Candidatus Bathyarchaeia archaeon]